MTNKRNYSKPTRKRKVRAKGLDRESSRTGKLGSRRSTVSTTSTKLSLTGTGKLRSLRTAGRRLRGFLILLSTHGRTCRRYLDPRPEWIMSESLNYWNQTGRYILNCKFDRGQSIISMLVKLPILRIRRN